MTYVHVRRGSVLSFDLLSSPLSGVSGDGLGRRRTRSGGAQLTNCRLFSLSPIKPYQGIIQDVRLRRIRIWYKNICRLFAHATIFEMNHLTAACFLP
jgi:hypothetical protein